MWSKIKDKLSLVALRQRSGLEDLATAVWQNRFVKEG